MQTQWLEILAFQVYPDFKESVTYIRSTMMFVEIIGESPEEEIAKL